MEKILGDLPKSAISYKRVEWTDKSGKKHEANEVTAKPSKSGAMTGMAIGTMIAGSAGGVIGGAVGAILGSAD